MQWNKEQDMKWNITWNIQHVSYCWQHVSIVFDNVSVVVDTMSVDIPFHIPLHSAFHLVQFPWKTFWRLSASQWKNSIVNTSSELKHTNMQAIIIIMCLLHDNVSMILRKCHTQKFDQQTIIIIALLILKVKMISIYFCTFNSIHSCPSGLYHSHHKCSHLHYKWAVTLIKQV